MVQAVIRCELSTLAHARALLNFEINSAFIPGLVFPDGLEFVFARDGALTCLEPHESASSHFRGGCSVPRAAAAAMMERVVMLRPVACLLDPMHAAHIESLLDRCASDEAVIVIVPDVRNAAMLLSCADFSNAFATGRLHVAMGEDWPRKLARLLRANPGLPTPGQMVRLHDSPSEPGLSKEVQRVSSEVENERVFEIGRCRNVAVESVEITQRRMVFALPGDADWTSATALDFHIPEETQKQMDWLDIGVPTRRSALEMARHASGAISVIIAELGRAEAGDVAGPQTAWITWCTTGRVPAVGGAMPLDRLIVTDQATRVLAIKNGWDTSRIEMKSERPVVKCDPKGAVLIALPSKDQAVPSIIKERSSVQLLWEQIEAELSQQPFLPRADVKNYVSQLSQRAGVELDEPAKNLIARRLIPRLLCDAVVNRLTELNIAFKKFEGTRHAFRVACERSSCIIDLWPMLDSHVVRRMGVPVVSAWQKSAKDFDTCFAR